ncbi:MAG: hypothetical protein ACYC6Y_31495 [Thermoguttaceae bacterium]
MKRLAKYILPPLAMIVLCAGIVIWHEVRLGLLHTSWTCAFGDIHQTAVDYRDAEGYWPRRIEDLGRDPAAYTDVRTGEPFVWYGDGNVYIRASARSDDGNRQVLMTLPTGYRRHIWDLRARRTLVLLGDGSILDVSLDDIYQENS